MDQKYRSGWDSAIQQYGMNSPQIIHRIRQMNFQDSVDMARVGGILDKYGWLSKVQTSADASDALFLVLQHATLPSQLKYLPALKKAVKEKKVKAADYALLLDRTNMYQGKFQIYGSQINYDEKGHIHIYPIDDEPDVNRRRKQVGLPSMKQYLKLFDPQFNYVLPGTDHYKNKIVLKGSVNDKSKNQPIAGVGIYTGHHHKLGMTDSSGFFMVLPNKKAKRQIFFSKDGYVTSEQTPATSGKGVIEINSILIKKR